MNHSKVRYVLIGFVVTAVVSIGVVDSNQSAALNISVSAVAAAVDETPAGATGSIDDLLASLTADRRQLENELSQIVVDSDDLLLRGSAAFVLGELGSVDCIPLLIDNIETALPQRLYGRLPVMSRFPFKQAVVKFDLQAVPLLISQMSSSRRDGCHLEHVIDAYVRIVGREQGLMHFDAAVASGDYLFDDKRLQLVRDAIDTAAREEKDG